MKKTLLLAIALLPQLASAQITIAVGQGPGIAGWLAEIINFFSNFVVPFLLGIAFLMVVVNAIRFFVIQGASQEGREKARALAVYSVLAFVVIFIFWGLLLVLTSGLGLYNQDPPEFDYISGTGP